MKTRIERITSLILFALFMPLCLFSQAKENSEVVWGLEYDLLAPRIGTWQSVNISVYVGHGRIKHSIIFARIDINNDHLTDESFQKDELTAFGYRGEIYSHKDMKRLSTGIILLYAKNDVITSISQQAGKFSTFFVGVPIGYTWVLWNHLTINPGINILIPLNNQTVKIGIDEVEQAPWGFEPGIRIGYRF
jgi:hypothetical protein